METKTVSKTWNEFEDFAIGDLVKLKSGSPAMTIDGTSGSRYTCVWFDGTTFQRQTLDQGALQKVAAKDQDLSPA